jgi:outer membrane protein assembly factor BamA
MGVVIALLALLVGQTSPPTAAPERLAGLAIERIDVRVPEGEDTGALLALTGLSIGKPYSAQDVRRAVKLLYQLDRFENVFVSAGRSGNSVILEIVLPPRPRVRAVRVETIEELHFGPPTRFASVVAGRVARYPRPQPKKLVLAQAEVEEAIQLKAGQELDVRELAKKQEGLKRVFRRLGYRSPAIGMLVERVDKAGSHDLLVRIDQGPRTRLRRALYQGELRRAEWDVSDFLGLDRGDYLDLKRLSSALEDLAQDYRERG